MPTEITYDSFYYGDESNQFSFYRIPRELITGERFTKLSTDAKLLYLSTAINYTLDTRAVTLGLAANEKITEIMLVFGQAPAGFAQVETPMLYCTAASNLTGGSAFVNVADAGGIYSGQWVQAVARWTTAIYGSTPVLPKTGY